jgi:putative hydrolase of the HAD superfamily
LPLCLSGVRYCASVDNLGALYRWLQAEGTRMLRMISGTRRRMLFTSRCSRLAAGMERVEPNAYIHNDANEATQHMRCENAAVGVVFDGDDTLWYTEQLYDDARWNARRIVADAGLDGAEWEKLERRIDVANVALLGYSMERFPTSCVLAYEEACRSQGCTPETAVADRIRHAARSVFARTPPLAPGARETLTCLRTRGARLALLTKGDQELQARRIEGSGLGDLFRVVQIVPEKSPTTIRSMVVSLGVNPESSWMVGNSIRSDVLPALAAGLRAIWINTHVWEYERAHDHLIDERVITISHLVDILDLVAI